jgi:hypothetical protein
VVASWIFARSCRAAKSSWATFATDRVPCPELEEASFPHASKLSVTGPDEDADSPTRLLTVRMEPRGISRSDLRNTVRSVPDSTAATKKRCSTHAKRDPSPRAEKSKGLQAKATGEVRYSPSGQVGEHKQSAAICVVHGFVSPFRTDPSMQPSGTSST